MVALIATTPAGPKVPHRTASWEGRTGDVRSTTRAPPRKPTTPGPTRSRLRSTTRAPPRKPTTPGPTRNRRVAAGSARYTRSAAQIAQSAEQRTRNA